MKTPTMSRIRRLLPWLPFAGVALVALVALAVAGVVAWKLGRPPKPPETAPLHVPTVPSLRPYRESPDAQAAYAEGFHDGAKTAGEPTYLNPNGWIMPRADEPAAKTPDHSP